MNEPASILLDVRWGPLLVSNESHAYSSSPDLLVIYLRLSFLVIISCGNTLLIVLSADLTALPVSSTSTAISRESSRVEMKLIAISASRFSGMYFALNSSCSTSPPFPPTLRFLAPQTRDLFHFDLSQPLLLLSPALLLLSVFKAICF